MKPADNTKIWHNGLTIDQTIQQFNRIFSKITKAHLKQFKCKHKVNVAYLVYDGIISESDLN